jgi:hypothetical protein
MVATGTVVAGCEPEPTRKKKYKKLHRRGVRREKVFDMGALVCVFIGMGLTWAYIDYRYPGVMPPILPKGNWSFVDRMQNGLAAQTLKRKRKAAVAKRKADREADRELEADIAGEDVPLWEALQPARLEKRDWQPDTQPSQLSRLRRPAAFKRTPVDGWGVRRTWTLDYLAEHENLQQVDHVYHQPHGYFLHHDDGAPLVTPDPDEAGGHSSGPRTSLQWEPPFSTMNCSARCFFGALQSGPKSAALEGCEQAAGECAAGMPLSLTMEMGPRFGGLWGDLEATGFRDFGVSDHAEPTVNMWIASAGTTTAAHYDSYHNFFTQLNGTKRFFLMPPSAAVALYAFPRLHPSYRQSQVDLTMQSNDPRLKEDFPRMADLVKTLHGRGSKSSSSMDAMVVDLEPGDVLYVPPYWFHLAMTPSALERSAGSLATVTPQQEEAERASRYSVGLNIWSEAEELHHVDAFEAVALPFEEDWSPSVRRTAVAAYTRIFLGAVVARGSAGAARKSLNLMMETRWAPLLDAFVDADDDALLLQDEVEVVQTVGGDDGDGGGAQPDDCVAAGSEAGEEDKVCAADTPTRPPPAPAGEPQLKEQLSEHLQQRQLNLQQLQPPPQKADDVEFGCTLAELPLDEEGRSHFTAKAEEAAAVVKSAGNFDSYHGERLVTVLAWNRVEQLAMWAMDGGGGTSTDGIDDFLTRLPRTCDGAV